MKGIFKHKGEQACDRNQRHGRFKDETSLLINVVRHFSAKELTDQRIRRSELTFLFVPLFIQQIFVEGF